MAAHVQPARNRILVLHGFYDSAQNREHQMRSLTRSMKEVDFVFIDAPYTFVDYGFLKSSDPPAADQRYQWFTYKPDWPVTLYNYDTIKECIAFLADYINREGPFDGLLGFSQGAIVCATMMLAIPHWPVLPKCVKYVILVGCPPINDQTIKPLFETANIPNQLPTLHVSGMNDTLIAPAMSKLVFEYFDPSLAEFYLHKGGHYCPNDSDFRRKLREFIAGACRSSP